MWTRSKNAETPEEAAKREAKIQAKAEAEREFSKKLFDLLKGLPKLLEKQTSVQSKMAARQAVDGLQAKATQAEMLRRLYQLTSRRPAEELATFGAAYFSQNGEDGIIAEIAARLDLQIASVVEIGAGDGRENNSLNLVLQGARAVWVECAPGNVETIRTLHAPLIKSGQIVLLDTQIDRDNVNDALRQAGAPRDLDLLSIDIDGNDYWVWQAIDAVTPKIVVAEYNAFFGPSASWTMAYNPEHMWPGGTTYYGASLKALETLGREKGYTLVGCDFAGVNAFFVRDDLVNDRFVGPFTSEAMYHPFRRAYVRETKTFEYAPFEAV